MDRINLTEADVDRSTRNIDIDSESLISESSCSQQPWPRSCYKPDDPASTQKSLSAFVTPASTEIRRASKVPIGLGKVTDNGSVPVSLASLNLAVGKMVAVRLGLEGLITTDANNNENDVLLDSPEGHNDMSNSTNYTDQMHTDNKYHFLTNGQSKIPVKVPTIMGKICSKNDKGSLAKVIGIPDNSELRYENAKPQEKGPLPLQDEVTRDVTLEVFNPLLIFHMGGDYINNAQGVPIYHDFVQLNVEKLPRRKFKVRTRFENRGKRLETFTSDTYQWNISETTTPTSRNDAKRGIGSPAEKNMTLKTEKWTEKDVESTLKGFDSNFSDIATGLDDITLPSAFSSVEAFPGIMDGDLEDVGSISRACYSHFDCHYSSDCKDDEDKKERDKERDSADKSSYNCSERQQQKDHNENSFNLNPQTTKESQDDNNYPEGNSSDRNNKNGSGISEQEIVPVPMSARTATNTEELERKVLRSASKLGVAVVEEKAKKFYGIVAQIKADKEDGSGIKVNDDNQLEGLHSVLNNASNAASASTSAKQDYSNSKEQTRGQGITCQPSVADEVVTVRPIETRQGISMDQEYQHQGDSSIPEFVSNFFSAMMPTSTATSGSNDSDGNDRSTQQPLVGDVSFDSVQEDIIETALEIGSKLITVGLQLATSIIGDESDLEPREDIVKYNGYTIRTYGRGLLLQGMYLNCNLQIPPTVSLPSTSFGSDLAFLPRINVALADSSFRICIIVRLTKDFFTDSIPLAREHGYDNISNGGGIRLEVDEEMWTFYYGESFVQIQVPCGVTPNSIHHQSPTEDGLLIIQAP